jgi:hypothetical protein
VPSVETVDPSGGTGGRAPACGTATATRPSRRRVGGLVVVAAGRTARPRRRRVDRGPGRRVEHGDAPRVRSRPRVGRRNPAWRSRPTRGSATAAGVAAPASVGAARTRRAAARARGAPRAAAPAAGRRPARRPGAPSVGATPVAPGPAALAESAQHRLERHRPVEQGEAHEQRLEQELLLRALAEARFRLDEELEHAHEVRRREVAGVRRVRPIAEGAAHRLARVGRVAA